MTKKQRVGIVKVVDQVIDEALYNLVELLGDLNTIIPRGSRILIKPNLVFPPTDRGITHTSLIEAIVHLVAQTSPVAILIGEGSADVYTSQGFRFQDLGRVANRYGARLVDLNLEKGVKIDVPPGLGREYVMVPQAVVESDIFISLPVFKLWGTPMSLSLKNLIGLYGARYYGHNKDSIQRANDVNYALPGDVGREQSAHKPSTAQSICAINMAVKTHLAIIDALEGGDGKGNFIRLNTLIGGQNPVATDTVACAMSGFDSTQYENFRLCADYGLGSCKMQDIEVVGLPLETVSFNLQRLTGNVLEMPVDYCLDLMSTGELEQILRALYIYKLVDVNQPTPDNRDDLMAMLYGRMTTDGYFTSALDNCTEYALRLLEIIINEGGTSSSMAIVEQKFSSQYPGLYYYPSHRVLTRLGLTYAVDSATRPYYIVPEGLVRIFRRVIG